MNEFFTPLAVSRKTFVLSALGLVVFLAFEAVLLRYFIQTDRRPPSWDQSVHMEIALDYREAISAGRWGDFWYLAPKSGMPPFPPAYHLLLRGAYDSNDPAHAALWLNWFYMAILAVSMFGISWRFLPDSRALAATIIFCAAPGLQDLLTTQLVDLAIVAWVAAAYWALLESEGFVSWPASIAFAVLHAVGMLHKWSFFSYMIPAYLVAARATRDRDARLIVTAAVGLSVLISAPWYWSHLALLPTRLVQASSDFAIPFWKQGAWAAYLIQSCLSLGPLLWALGFVAILAPQYERRRENAWVIVYWFVCAYIFWTVVPNRQIRFLLPGLTPLGFALASAWPRALTWAVVVFQLLGAANFFLGFVGPWAVPTPVMPLTFFVNRPPAPDQWKLEEILKRAEDGRDPTRAIANVTLVANDEYVNGPTLNWTQRWLKLPHVRMRGVNKRLCELSEFVLVKSGRLGPASVIGDLPKAVETINTPDGWFERSYQVLETWPLPDASEAVLFQQKRGRSRPIPQTKIDVSALQTGELRIANLHAEFGAWDKNISAWDRSQLRADVVNVRGLAVRDVSAQLMNFSITKADDVGLRQYDWDNVRVMRLDRVVVNHLSVTAEDLKIFIEKRAPGLVIENVVLDQTVKVQGRWQGRTVAAEAALDYDREDQALRIRIVSASYMGWSVPKILFRPIKELNLSLRANPETPFDVDLAGLTIKDGRLTIP